MARADTWFTSYSSNEVQGIFYDMGPYLGSPCQGGARQNQPPIAEDAQKSDYSSIYSHIHGEPGAPTVLLNASGFPNEWVMSGTYKSADYAITFEDTYANWSNINMELILFRGVLPVVGGGFPDATQTAIPG